MKMTRDAKGQPVHAFVFTGDGRTEFKHLSALCEKLNGVTKLLWFPELPMPLRSKEKQTGLAGLRIIRDLVITQGQSRLLFVVDREHFKSQPGEESEEVKTCLSRQVHARIQSVLKINQREAFLFKASISSRQFELCLGIRSTHEQEMAQLIRLRFDLDVEPSDSVIRKFLKQRKMDEEGLIRQCPHKHLAEAFPGLYSALEWVEKQA
jgi:hypothetical protein